LNCKIKLTDLWKNVVLYYLWERRGMHIGILVGKPEGKRPLGRPRRRWVDSYKMDLRDIRWDGVDWINMAQDMDQWRTLVNMILSLRVP
jgi:hypothetical protein